MYSVLGIREGRLRIIPEVEYSYELDWFRIIVYKDGTVMFDTAHEEHTMAEEDAMDLAEALYYTLGPGAAK
jgi:hypothetical protein